MPSYSVSLNAVVSPTGGSVARLDAVCAAGPTSNYVVVATTANLAVAGGRFRGVALEAASGNQAIQIVDFGTVDLLTTVLTGTGEYVSVNATGQLVRTTTVTSATIGTLENGTIHVNVALSMGAATIASATAIQGMSVSATAPVRGSVLASDGAIWYPRKQVPHFADYSPAGDGTTDDSAKLQQFLTDMGTYGGGHIDEPPGNNGYLISNMVIARDSTADGNLRGIHLTGHLADPFNVNATGFTFVNGVTCPSGNAATISSYGNGPVGWVYPTPLDATGSGSNMQMITGLSGVLAADEDLYVGRSMRLWYCDTKAHNGEFYVVAVPANNVVIIAQPNTGAAGTDANSGSIRWKIYMPMWQIRMREFRLEGMAFTPANGGGKRGPLLEVGQSDKVGGTSVIQWAVARCAFASGSSTRLARYGVQVAKQIVPRVGHPERVLNGAGIPQVINTSQVDTGRFDRCAFAGMDEMGVAHSSASAQSKEVTFEKCQFGPSSRNLAGYGGIGYGCPRNTFAAGGVYSAEGSPGVNFSHCSFGALDLAVQLGSGSSAPVDFVSCYWESARRLLRAYSAAVPRVINFFGCGLAPTGTQPHPSCEAIEMLGEGPLNFFGSNPQFQDNSYYHIVCTSTGVRETKVNFFGCWFKGAPAWTGKRARVTARLCGPYSFNSGDTLVFAVDAGANQTVTITVANFTTAGVANVDLDQVESWQLGKLIDYYVTGCEAWGEFDNAPPVVESATQGAASRIEFVSATGKAAYVDFPTGVQAGVAQSALSLGTSGYIDSSRSAGNINIAVGNFGNLAASYTTTTVFAWPEGVRRFGTALVNDITGPNGGTFTAVTGGIVTVAGAAVTITDTRVTANSIVTLIPTNPDAVTLGAWYLSARTANTSFQVTFPGAPGGTETYIYTITDPT